MRIRTKVALTVVFCLAAVGTVNFAFALMDRKSTAAFYSGIVMLLASFVLYPTVYGHLIFRRKQIDVQK